MVSQLRLNLTFCSLFCKISYLNHLLGLTCLLRSLPRSFYFPHFIYASPFSFSVLFPLTIMLHLHIYPNATQPSTSRSFFFNQNYLLSTCFVLFIVLCYEIVPMSKIPSLPPRSIELVKNQLQQCKQCRRGTATNIHGPPVSARHIMGSRQPCELKLVILTLGEVEAQKDQIT